MCARCFLFTGERKNFQITKCSLRFGHLTNFLLYRYATVEQAVKALKIDILRTFKARLEMHCDSLVGDEIQAQ